MGSHFPIFREYLGLYRSALNHKPVLEVKEDLPAFVSFIPSFIAEPLPLMEEQRLLLRPLRNRDETIDEVDGKPFLFYGLSGRSITGNMSSSLDKNVPYWSNSYDYNQHIISSEIVRRSSSYIVSIIVVIGIFYSICSSQLSIINVPLLHKELNVSIWSSLLGLFGLTVFLCAVAVMFIFRAAFTSMQKAMLIFWAILLHLQSANSIIEVFLTLAGGLFVGWFAFRKKQPSNEII